MSDIDEQVKAFQVRAILRSINTKMVAILSILLIAITTNVWRNHINDSNMKYRGQIERMGKEIGYWRTQYESTLKGQACARSN